MAKQPTWGECLHYTLKYKDTWRNGGGRKSAITYSGYFTDFQGDSFPVSRITPPLMTRLCVELENQGRTNATINRFISAVSTVLKFCVDEQLIKLDVPRFQRRREAETMRKWFTKDQVKLICKEAEETWQREDLSDIVLFAALTGMRQGEILRLQVKNVDFITNNIHVGTKPTDTTKNGTYRAIPIHPELEHMLVNRTKDKHPNSLVFGNDWKNKNGTPDKDVLLRAFKNVINNSRVNLKSEEGYCFHSLRHSFGTWHFASGSKPRQVMDLMGHKNIVTTLIYGKATDEGKREAINNLAY